MNRIPKDKFPLLSIYSELVGRMSLASRLGADTYGGERDLYGALGYPKKINVDDYWNKYERQDIAKAIIDRPVKASWKGFIKVIEDVDKNFTPFEKKWKELYDKLKLKSIFIRADKLTGLGQYSVLLLGLDDVKELEDFKKPVTQKKEVLKVPIKKQPKLVYVKPISQRNATIHSYNTDAKSERFGLPKFYNIDITSGEKNTTIQVHHTRVVHLVEDLVENEVLGTPRLKAVYNRLLDMDKLIGGDAEMFWRGARPGYTGEVNPEYTLSEGELEKLETSLVEFEHNLRRILIDEGITYKALEQQISDPKNHVDVQMQMISAVTAIPKRILTGSERGELSSAQDKQEWISYVTSRREEQNEPMILRPFIDHCIMIGVLPAPKLPYKIIWDKLFSLSDTEKVEMGTSRAKALRDYTTNLTAQELVPLRIFAEYFLGFDSDHVEELMVEIGATDYEESRLSKIEAELLIPSSDDGDAGDEDV